MTTNHTTSADCPICLYPMIDSKQVMYMPICGHCIHTTCALSAAQYDVRCPVCRTRDPLIESKMDRETRILGQLEEFASRQDRIVRSYKKRRAAAIRRRPSLKRMQNRFRDEKKKFSDLNLELERAWTRMQRDRWNNDATIKDIKLRRRKQQRRLYVANRRLNDHLRPLVGSPPESIELL